MKTLKRWALVAILTLSVAVGAFALAACGSEEEMSAEAETVTYEPSGAYTTKLTARSGVSLADLTAADLQVGYPVVDPTWIEQQAAAADRPGDASDAGADGAAADMSRDASDTEADGAATDESGDVSDAETNETTATDGSEDASTAESDGAKADGSDDEDWEEAPAVTVYAEVKDFTVSDDGTATLTFEDPKASENQPEMYTVCSENGDFWTQVGVDYPGFTLDPDVSYVPADSEATKLTLTLAEGEYAPDVTADAVELGGSFASMSVESLSSAGQSLTLQLTGKPSEPEGAGAYAPGSVGLKPEAIVHASRTTYAYVPIEVDGVGLLASGLKVEDGTVTLPMVVRCIADPSTLTVEQVSITGGEPAVTVKSVQATGDDEVTLTLDMPGIDSGNAAAAALTGQTLKVADYEIAIDLPDASFYPVFDYVGADGDDLKLTLIAYVSGGTLADELSPDDATLANGFADGKVTSVERTGDATATIELAIPAKGATPETIDLTGTVTLAPGTLVSDWGEPTEWSTSSTRSYSASSLGRKASDYATNYYIKELIKSYQNTVNNPNFVKGVDTISSLGDPHAMVMNLLTFCGITQNANVEISRQLQEIRSSLEEIKQLLVSQAATMREMRRTQYDDRCIAFDTAVNQLAQDNAVMANYFSRIPSLGVPTPPDGDGAIEDGPYAGLTTGEAWGRYLTDVVQAMYDADRVGNGDFDGFSRSMDSLEANYRTVASALGATSDGANAIYNYDYLCSLVFNFDTLAEPYRQSFRANAEFQVDRALAFLYARYNAVANPNGVKVQQMADLLHAAERQLDERPIVSSESIYFYIPGIYVDRELVQAQVWVTEATGPGRAIIEWGNLDATQQDDFARRLNGRSCEEVLTEAGFTGLREECVALNQWVEFEKRSAFRYDYYHTYIDCVHNDESSVDSKVEIARYRDHGANHLLGENRWDFQYDDAVAAFKYHRT